MDKLTQSLLPPSRIDLAREPDFRLGAVMARPSRREVEACGVRHLLQPRVMQVLVALARSPNEVVSQQELILRCWAGLSVSDDAIGRCIGQLRRLAASWAEPPFEIETIAGVGYRLEPLRPVVAPSPSVLSPGRRAGTRRRLRDWIRGRSRLLGVAIVALLTVAAAGWAGVAWLGRTASGATPLIAVRSMSVVGSDPRLQPFAARVSDQIAGFLGESDVRVVTGFGSKAQLAFGGSVSGAADQLTVRLFLEDVRSGTTIWSHDYAGPVDRADALIDAAKGGAMETTNVVRSFYVASGPSLDPETALLVIRGSEELGVPTADGDVGAVREFRQALSRRQDIPGLHAMYALALVSASGAAPPGDRAQMLRQARAEVDQTIRDHPDQSGLALHVSTMIQQAEAPFDWVGAEQRLDRLVQASPEDPFVNGDKCGLLLQLGRAGDSLYYCRRALSLRPHTPLFLTLYVQALDSLQSEVPQSPEPVLEEGARLYPDYFPLRAYRFAREAFGGSPDRALQRLREPAVAALFPPADIHPIELLEKARKSGTRADADAALAAMRLADRHQPIDDFRFLFPMALGRVDEAFSAPDIAQLAGAERDALTLRFTEPLRRDARWWPLAAKAGLVRYWLTTNRWPDFCSDPTYPLDCRAQARRVMALSPRA